MWRKLFQTENDFSLLLMRLILGAVMLPHGAQKVLGVLGGPGINQTISMFHDQMGFPPVIAILVMLAEFLGSIFLIIGFMTRFSALSIAAVMGGAIWYVHISNGMFMNWMGNQKGEGFEFHLLAIAVALGLAFRGAGALSLDRSIGNR